MICKSSVFFLFTSYTVTTFWKPGCTSTTTEFFKKPRWQWPSCQTWSSKMFLMDRPVPYMAEPPLLNGWNERTVVRLFGHWVKTKVFKKFTVQHFNRHLGSQGPPKNVILKPNKDIVTKLAIVLMFQSALGTCFPYMCCPGLTWQDSSVLKGFSFSLQQSYLYSVSLTDDRGVLCITFKCFCVGLKFKWYMEWDLQPSCGFRWQFCLVHFTSLCSLIDCSE